jgi:hypothetical protein
MLLFFYFLLRRIWKQMVILISLAASGTNATYGFDFKAVPLNTSFQVTSVSEVVLK